MTRFDIRIRRNTTEFWVTRNPVLDEGEQGYDLDLHTYRIGDGLTAWNDLDEFIPASAVRTAIALAVANVGPSTGDHIYTDDAILIHVNSPAPHPVYDDGPTFTLLYENAKV